MNDDGANRYAVTAVLSVSTQHCKFVNGSAKFTSIASMKLIEPMTYNVLRIYIGKYPF